MSAEDVKLPPGLELERFVSLDEVARLRGTSRDTVRRNDADKIVKLSPRRDGMRLRDALMLGPKT
jgi:hypothetical protein